MSTDNTVPNLMQVQVQLEESMKERGTENYTRAVNNAKASGSENHTQYGNRLVSGLTKLLADKITEFKEESLSGRAGRKHAVTKFVGDGITSEQMAYITLKTIIAGISGGQKVNDLSVQIGMAMEDEIRLDGIRKQEKRVYKSIVEGTMKRGSQHYKHMYAVRRAEYFEDNWVTWSIKTRAYVGSKMIELVTLHLDLVDVVVVNGKKKSCLIYAKPSTVAWIEKYNMAGVRSPFEPMVVRPRDWTTPYDGGYITSNIKPFPLVKRITKKRLKALYETADMPKVYTAINALQHTEWQINGSVLDVLKTLWESGSELGGIPSKADYEEPLKPLDMETNVGAFKQWKRDASQAHRNHVEAISSRIAYSMTIDVAKRYSEFKRIFMPYQLDFRGRIYALPHLNPQGADFQKSLLRFSKGKPLGARGSIWLAIHGANVAGVDKVDFQTRYNWVEDNEAIILAIAADPYQNKEWCGSIGDVEIDKPWQFLAFCFEWAGFVAKGESFISHLPVALDGSCSGIQMFSAMLLDKKGGAAVNLLPADKPSDVYQEVADAVLIEVNQDILTGTEDSITPEGRFVAGTKTLATQWLSFGITRKTCKRPVMTLAYGSREYGFKEQLLSDTLSPAQKDMGDAFPFGEDGGYMAAGYLAKKIWEAVTVTLVAAVQAMEWIKEIAGVANKAEVSINWVAPSGFPVEQSYKNMMSIRVDTAINGRTNLQLEVPTDAIDYRRQRSAISPNFVHSIDGAAMTLTVVACKEQGVDSFAVIHDSFGTHAADTDTLFALVREVFVDMFTQNEVLDNFKKAVHDSITDEVLREELPDDLVKGDLDLEEVKFSMYCFA